MLSSLMRRLNQRRAAEFDAAGSAEAGFTLIELMVVLLILAILLAIAIPTFLGVTKSANDRASQSNLNTAVTNAKAYYQQNGQSYGTGTTAAAAVQGALSTQEPSLTFTTGTITAGTGAGSIVSVYVSTDGNGVVLTAWSKAGWCWVLADNTATIVPVAADLAYGGSAGTLNIPTAAGTKYGKVAAATAGLCGAGQALPNTIPYSSSGFPS